jgi:DNA-binding transcriptional LysR family regulator
MFRRPDWDTPSGLPRLTASDPAIIPEAALSGAGIVRLWSTLVQDHLETGRMLRVLPHGDPPNAPVAARLTSDPEALPCSRLVLRDQGLTMPPALQASGATASELAAP